MQNNSRLGHSLAIAILACGFAACSKPAPLVTMPAKSPEAVLFENTGVLDVANGRITPGQDVLVTGSKITAIGTTGTLTVPATASRIDGRGKTLLPGLVDSHGHVANGSSPPWLKRFPDPDRNLQAFLYCGVTTVLDPADLAPDAFERRDAVAAGKLLGPTIFASGPMLTAIGGHPLPVIDEIAPWWIRWYVRSHAVRPLGSDEDVRKAIDELAAAHADVVKMAIDSVPDSAPRLTDALAASVVRMAHAKGLRVVSHVGTLADALEAGNAGVDAFMHMVYKEALDDAGAAKLAAFRKPIVATMAVFENYAMFGHGPRMPTPLETETADRELLESFDHPPAGGLSPMFQAYFELLYATRQARRDNVKLLRANGATILAGSDAQTGVFPGAGLHRELALLVEGGMTPAEAIRAATLDPARFIEKTEDPSFGVVAVGKRADLLLVGGDPTTGVAELSKIHTVMKNGVALERHAIGG
ncbi:MAG TPA: amidohydrolase family protein [Candidatus Limnocylindrales bacterium]|nr:amidohydrolase family protein [Candidatus Limnocylindrales bacterium]